MNHSSIIVALILTILIGSSQLIDPHLKHACKKSTSNKDPENISQSCIARPFSNVVEDFLCTLPDETLPKESLKPKENHENDENAKAEPMNMLKDIINSLMTTLKSQPEKILGILNDLHYTLSMRKHKIPQRTDKAPSTNFHTILKRIHYEERGDKDYSQMGKNTDYASHSQTGFDETFKDYLRILNNKENVKEKHTQYKGMDSIFLDDLNNIKKKGSSHFDHPAKEKYNQIYFDKNYDILKTSNYEKKKNIGDKDYSKISKLTQDDEIDDNAAKEKFNLLDYDKKYDILKTLNYIKENKLFNVVYPKNLKRDEDEFHKAILKSLKKRSKKASQDDLARRREVNKFSKGYAKDDMVKDSFPGLRKRINKGLRNAFNALWNKYFT